MPGRGQDLGRPPAHAAHCWLADIEHLPGDVRVAQAREHGRGDVADVPSGPQPRPGADRNARATGPYPAQYELLPALGVVLAIDHGQPEHRRAALQIGRFDVELVVVFVADNNIAVRVPDRAQPGLLVQRHRLALPIAVEHQVERLVHVHTGQ